MEGELVVMIECNFVLIGYVQFVDNLGCNELGIGEINYVFLFVLFDWFGYVGYVGCEYKFCIIMMEGFGWL